MPTNTDSKTRLEELAKRFSEDFKSFGVEPIVVAQSTSCFDDKSDLTPWRGLQVGEIFWEWRDYFGEDINVEIGEQTYGNANLADAQIKRAHEILTELIKEDWIELADQAFNSGKGSRDETVAFVYQCDRLWLVISSSNSCGSCTEMAYLLSTEAKLLKVCTPTRFDERLGMKQPLALNQCDEATEILLKNEMPNFHACREKLFLN